METADLARENALLKARLAEVEATLAETQEANRRLQDILHAAQREKFGKRSEKLSPDQFNIIQSIDLLLMVVIGGLGSIHGAFLGAIFLIGLPQAISAVKDFLPDTIGQAPGLKAVVYGTVLIAFVLFEPLGLYGRWLKVRTYLQLFPFYRKGLFKRQKAFQKSDRLK